MLEVLPTSPSDRILAAYNRKKRQAKVDLDEAAEARYETAYNAILMENMRKRLTGGPAVQEQDNNIRFADRR